MAYHIHRCKLHDECAVLVNTNNKFKTHVHVTNVIRVPTHLVESKLCFSDDDDCLVPKVD